MVPEINDQHDMQILRAVSDLEFEGAFRCLYQSYRKRGLIPQGRLAMRLTRHHLVPSTCVFIARAHGEVVGTLSLVDDRTLGVPMRSVFGSEVVALARGGHQIAEATCLAVADSPLNGLEIVNGLIGLTIQTAARRGISRILIAVHPRHAPFYKRGVGLREFAGVRPYPSVGGLPAVGLELNLATWPVECPTAHRRFFGMNFSWSRSQSESVSQLSRARIVALWQDTHLEASDDDWDMSQAFQSEDQAA